MTSQPKRSKESHAAGGALGGLTRVGAPPERIEEARRHLKHVTAKDFLRRILAEAPELTESQRQDLAALLVPAGGVAA